MRSVSALELTPTYSRDTMATLAIGLGMPGSCEVPTDAEF